MEILLPIIRDRYEGQEVRDRTQNLDERRKINHDVASAKINQLNRLSETLNLEPFANIDTEDKYAVADFCNDFVQDIYGTTVEERIKQRLPEFDTEKIKKDIDDIDKEL